MSHLFNREKLRYVKGDKPDVDCVLCAIDGGSPEVPDLVIAGTENFIVAVNLYPYNTGHLMIFPRRHITSPDEFTENEALESHRVLAQTLKILREEYSPAGFNIGYNLGRNSGASVEHLHLHIVPRFENEVGYLDVLAGTRIIVGDPKEMRDHLKKRFQDTSPGLFIPSC